jgi:hypothetical protein
MKKLTLTALMLSSLFAGTASSASLYGEYDKPGYVTRVEDGRLWVFRAGSRELGDFKVNGEPARQFTDIGAGPDGMTIKAADEQTLKDYLEKLKK